MSCTFHYHDGNIVQIGDLVNTGNGTLGVVEEILDIGEDNSLQHNCPNGGILIAENWNGTKSYLLLQPPDGSSWEDLNLIRRG